MFREPSLQKKGPDKPIHQVGIPAGSLPSVTLLQLGLYEGFSFIKEIRKNFL
jgi:hypothetical protein